MHKETGRMLKEDNTFINRADYVYNSHRDYYKRVSDFGVDIVKGEVPGHTVIHKFGRNSAVSSSFVPICESGFYRTPTTNTALEVVSTDADDNASGAGARTIYYEGLQVQSGSLVVVSDVVELDGTTAVALPDSLIRLYRWYVASSGVYASQSVGSHQGDISIQESGAGNVWAKIAIDTFGRGQSQIGAYTVPTGYSAFMTDITSSVESDKEAEILLFQRNGVLNTTAPYDPMRLVTEISSAKGVQSINLSSPLKFEEETDIIFFAKQKKGDSPATIDFTLYLVQNV
jgi:hypothetical protein